jgi:cell division protein FtsZ
VDAAAKVIEEIAGAEDTIFGAVYDEKMGDRIKITVIATGFNQNGNERAKGAGEHIRASNVIPLALTEANKSIDFQLASIRENLDEPAFRRRRAE